MLAANSQGQDGELFTSPSCELITREHGAASLWVTGIPDLSESWHICLMHDRLSQAGTWKAHRESNKKDLVASLVVLRRPVSLQKHRQAGWDSASSRQALPITSTLLPLFFCWALS